MDYVNTKNISAVLTHLYRVSQITDVSFMITDILSFKFCSTLNFRQ